MNTQEIERLARHLESLVPCEEQVGSEDLHALEKALMLLRPRSALGRSQR